MKIRPKNCLKPPKSLSKDLQDDPKVSKTSQDTPRPPKTTFKRLPSGPKGIQKVSQRLLRTPPYHPARIPCLPPLEVYLLKSEVYSLKSEVYSLELEVYSLKL